MAKYLRLVLTPATPDDADVIIENLRTTLDEEPIIDHEGDIWLHVQSDHELMMESFCLGMLYSELEDDGLEDPFFLDVVDRDDVPSDIVTTMPSMLN